MTILIMRQGQTQTISLNEIEHFQFKAGDQLWIDRSPGQGAEEIRIEGNSLVLADGTTIRLLGALSKLISSGQVNLYLDDVSTHLSAEKSHNTNEHSDSVQANNNDSTDKSAENAHAKTTAPLTIEQSIALLESNPTASGDFAFVNASGVSNSGQQISISNAQNSTQEISLVSTNQPSSSGGSVASSVFTISSGQSDPSLSSAPVDTTAPAAPIITAISDNVGVVDGISLATPTLVTDNSTTNDSTPSLSGKAEPGSTVTIIDTKDDGTKIVLGTAVTAANGDWTFTPGTGTGASTPLSSGAHHITVTSTDPTGNVSAASSALTFTVDTAAPSAPVLSRVDDNVAIGGAVLSGDNITAVASNGRTNDNTPSFRGTAEAGSIVTILDNGTLIGTAIAGTDGSWTFTPESQLSDSTHSITFTSTDAAGNVSAASSALTFTVDTAAPSAPVLSRVDDNVAIGGAALSGANITAVASNGRTNDNTPSFKGTAEAGSTVTIFDNGTLIGTATAGTDGSWIFAQGSALTNGAHSITITSTDLAGNTSTPSSAFVFTVDTTAPTAPTLNGVDDNVGTGGITPVANNGTTNDNTPTFRGTAEAGSTVTVRDNGVTIGTATATNGAWQVTPGSALANGTHNITFTSTDAAGNVSSATAARTFTVDTTPPPVPSIDSVQDNVRPASGSFENVVSTSGNGPTSNDNTLTFIGTCSEAGAIVEIHEIVNGVDTIVATSAAVSATGANANIWSATPTIALADGAHHFFAVSRDAVGNISGRSEVNAGSSGANSTFNVFIDATTTAPGITATNDTGGGTHTPTALTPSATNPATLSIATNDTTPTLTGTFEAGSTVTFQERGANGALTTLSPTITRSGSNWIAGFNTAFSATNAAGSTTGNVHHLLITSTDAQGNVNTTNLDLVVDTTAPTATLANVIDNFGNKTGIVANNTNTDDKTLTFNGTAEANSTITFDIFNSANQNRGTFTATADANGNWAATSPTLVLGSVRIAATITDPAGNTTNIASIFNTTVLSATNASNEVNHAAIPAALLSDGNGGDTTVTAVAAPTLINAGDVNNDGQQDIVIHTPQSDPNVGSAAGTDALVFGSDDGSDQRITVDQLGTTADDTLTGTTAAETIVGLDGNDIIVGAGGADVFYGATGDDIFVLNASNISALTSSTFGIGGGMSEAHIDGGSGIDTLRLDGIGLNLDLHLITNSSSGLASDGARINSVEAIDLGNQQNTLTLTLGDVLDMSNANTFNANTGWTGITSSSTEQKQMLIEGGAQDHLVLENGPGAWQKSNEVVIHGDQQYAVYNNVHDNSGGGGAQLLINMTIQVVNHDAVPV